MFVFFRIGVTNSYNKHSNKTLYPSKNLTYFLLYWIFLIGNNAHWVVLMQHSISPYTREGWVYIRLEGTKCHSTAIGKFFFFLIILKKISSFFSLNIYIQIFFYILGNLKNQLTTYLCVKFYGDKIISQWWDSPHFIFVFSYFKQMHSEKRNKYKTNISQIHLYLNGRREFDSITAGQALIPLPPMEK